MSLSYSINNNGSNISPWGTHIRYLYDQIYKTYNLYNDFIYLSVFPVRGTKENKHVTNKDKTKRNDKGE